MHHINIHEYRPINSTISLPKQVNKGLSINFIVLHSIPIIINLTPDNVLENATQFTILYIVFKLCHTCMLPTFKCGPPKDSVS